jgi:hypothetical protein
MCNAPLKIEFLVSDRKKGNNTELPPFSEDIEEFHCVSQTMVKIINSIIYYNPLYKNSGKVVGVSLMECLFFGVRSPYVYEVYETAKRLGINVRGFIDNVEEGDRPDDLSPLLSVADIDKNLLDLPVVFPLTTPGHRQAAVKTAASLGFSRFASLVDPTSVIASSVEMNEGLLVNGLSIVGAMTRMGRFVIINRGVSIGHHVMMDDFVTIGPGAVVCGSVRIEKGAFIGAGAVVNPRLSIGANSVIGSGAVVIRDVPDNTVVVGNPARVIKENIPGYNGVAVE